MQANTTQAIEERVKPNAGLGVLVRSEYFTNLIPGVHTLGGQGNSLAIETARGVVIVDAGPGGGVTRAMITRLRELSAAPVLAIVYSHGHSGYNAGARLWQEHAAERGEIRPALIAQAGVPARYRRYTETAQLQAWLNSRQFRKTMRPASADSYPMPDQTFDSRMVIDGGDRRIELIAAPSETDDALAVWLPESRFLYGGASMIRSIPNVGTPLRTIRDPLRWANTLERLYALNPTQVLPEFGDPITDPQEIHDAFQVPIRALRYLRDAVVERMNAGMNEREILHDMVYPEALFGHKWMRPIYGDPEYIVREIWRMENGWWDRNPTHLHPARPAEAANAVLSALGNPGHVLDEARRLQAEGDTQLALHVIDLLALADPVIPEVIAARALKAALCRQRAEQMRSIVSRQILLSSAEDLLGLPIGSTSAEDPPADFSWN
ncbi:beta-lactamase domain containing protein (plasmid) [Cupriavidus necator N-1]|uniref:Beta-lactamase domain containing protein n=1 Tax=Cupriavidus necator (strain ATCC 43291 / DSM 13513 / CCUG 52238 / LMG 8453 / N-1) TaxID=1042878 RepID=F8GYQ7_CUPNN|nr:alkyl sulfatase dimerization domain-containing protein [Cupriavidus necator]AEI82998.1 beta-lactamase domain containing protein [Cupriavidus necator N-1]MDX6008783.1 alkyl sulfatase dimerization domain-containing protein [Cupriavidus necator]